MQYTKNLNLKKPDQNDYVNIADINENMDVLDESVQKKYEKPTTGISKTDLSQPVQDSLQKADNAATQTELTKTNEAVATHMADLAHVHWIGTAVGTNTLTATYEAITTLKNGLGVAFLNTTSSTGATTLNINGFGAIPILKANGNPVTNLKANGIYTLRYANGNFILQGEGGEYGTATASDVIVGKTIGTENGLVEGIATIASLGGKRWAGGVVTSDSLYKVTISGLNFKPKLIIIQGSDVSYPENQATPYTIYNQEIKFLDYPYASSLRQFDFVSTSGRSAITGFNLDGTEFYVRDTSFRLAVGLINRKYYWYAFE